MIKIWAIGGGFGEASGLVSNCFPG